MNSVLKSCLVICTLVQMTYAVYPEADPNSKSLANLLLSSQLASQDPLISTNCFVDYIAKSNEISKTYSQQYNKCLLDANSDRRANELEMAGKRSDIAKMSKTVCIRLKACDGLNSSFDTFNCHANIGINNTKDVYSISSNASEYVTTIQEQYHIIDFRQEKCCKSAERTYYEAAAANYRQLQNCLEGNTNVRNTLTVRSMPLTTLAPESSITEDELNPESTNLPITPFPDGVDTEVLPTIDDSSELLQLFK